LTTVRETSHFAPNARPALYNDSTLRIGGGLGIIEPCLPSPAKAPPSGPGWIHEIKHDGFRILARRNDAGVQLITRAGNDFSSRFPFITTAVGKLTVRSCVIDGEAIVCAIQTALRHRLPVHQSRLELSA
jgi:ATP-dependent DNA ligase